MKLRAGALAVLVLGALGGPALLVSADAAGAASLPSLPLVYTCTAADTIAAFKRSGTRLACLCGSDDAYARKGENAAKALRAAGASRIYLVGEPGTRSGQLRPAGVDAFIFAGCDALSILRAALGVDASIR